MVSSARRCQQRYSDRANRPRRVGTTASRVGCLSKAAASDQAPRETSSPLASLKHQTGSDVEREWPAKRPARARRRGAGLRAPASPRNRAQVALTGGSRCAREAAARDDRARGAIAMRPRSRRWKWLPRAQGGKREAATLYSRSGDSTLANHIESQQKGGLHKSALNLLVRKAPHRARWLTCGPRAREAVASDACPRVSAGRRDERPRADTLDHRPRSLAALLHARANNATSSAERPAPRAIAGERALRHFARAPTPERHQSTPADRLLQR